MAVSLKGVRDPQEPAGVARLANRNPKATAVSDYQKRLKRVIRLAKSQGWTVTKNGHVKFKGPDGQVVCCSWSPRCPYVFNKLCKELRLAGLDLAGKW